MACRSRAHDAAIGDGRNTPPETPTGVAERRVYVQVEPNCLTTAPVSRCEGHLLRVYKRSGDAEEWRLTEMKERLPLEWSRMGQVPVTLYPSGGQYLNVCHRGSQLTVIIPAVHPLPLRWREVFDSVGTFRFEIEITAEDCEPVHAFVDVSLDDREWNTPDVYLTVI